MTVESVLPCPLCGLGVRRSELEVHLRLEMDYWQWRCGLCPVRFAAFKAANAHFKGRFSVHPGREPVLVETQSDSQDAELGCLLDAAFGSRKRGADPPLSPLPLAKLCRTEEPESPPQDNPYAMEEPAEAPAHRVKAEPSDAASEEEDAKPTDGKVACLLCGSRQKKDNFKLHALRAHMDAQPFVCRLCPSKAKMLSDLTKHQKKAHDVATTADTFISLMDGLRAELSETMEQCFGSAQNVDYIRIDCRTCRKSIRANEAKDHVASVHLRQPVYACRLCEWSSVNWRIGSAKKHLRSVHQEAPGPDVLDNRAAALLPVLLSLATELFGKACSV